MQKLMQNRIRRAIAAFVITVPLAAVLTRCQSSWTNEFTPEEFEAGMAKGIKTIPEWEAYIKSISTRHILSNNLAAIIHKDREPFKAGASVNLLPPHKITEAVWVFRLTCLTKKEQKLLDFFGPLYNYQTYEMVLSADLKVIGWRWP